MQTKDRERPASETLVICILSPNSQKNDNTPSADAVTVAQLISIQSDNGQRAPTSAKKKSEEEIKQGKIGLAATVVYHETGGLEPTTDTGPGSAEDLHDARIDEATVFYHHPSQFTEGDEIPLSNIDKATAAFVDSLSAAEEAYGRGDIGLHAIIYDPLTNYPQVRWMQDAYAIPGHGGGPFLNSSGGGDVRRNDQVFVVIMRDLSYREQQNKWQ